MSETYEHYEHEKEQEKESEEEFEITPEVLVRDIEKEYDYSPENPVLIVIEPIRRRDLENIENVTILHDSSNYRDIGIGRFSIVFMEDNEIIPRLMMYVLKRGKWIPVDFQRILNKYGRDVEISPRLYIRFDLVGEYSDEGYVPPKPKILTVVVPLKALPELFNIEEPYISDIFNSCQELGERGVPSACFEIGDLHVRYVKNGEFNTVRYRNVNDLLSLLHLLYSRGIISKSGLYSFLYGSLDSELWDFFVGENCGNVEAIPLLDTVARVLEKKIAVEMSGEMRKIIELVNNIINNADRLVKMEREIFEAEVKA